MLSFLHRISLRLPFRTDQPTEIGLIRLMVAEQLISAMVPEQDKAGNYTGVALVLSLTPDGKAALAIDAAIKRLRQQPLVSHVATRLST